MKAILNKYLTELNLHTRTNEGERLMQNKDQFTETEDFENLILVLLERSYLWHNGMSFNYDYRMRTLTWLHEHENDSVVVYAGLTRLMETDAAGENPVVTMESLAGRTPIRDKVNLSGVSEDEEIKLWLIDPEFIRENSTRFSSFVTDRAKFTEYIEFLANFEGLIYENLKKAKKKLRAEKAVFDLIESNLTESAASFRFLRQYDTELEIAAFNVRLYRYSKDIRSDNIKVRFLNCLCNITEQESLDGFTLSVIRDVMSGKFSRNVGEVRDCSAYFKQLVRDSWGDVYHPVYMDTDSYLKLYHALEDWLDFRYAGFLAFNPLEPVHDEKFHAVSKKHRLELLLRNMEEMYRRDPKETYSEEQMTGIRKLYGWLTELCRNSQNQSGEVTDAVLFAFLSESDGAKAITVLVQSGLMNLSRVAAERDISWFLRSLDRERFVLFTTELWENSGILPETALTVITLCQDYDYRRGMYELDKVMKSDLLADDEKRAFFSMYLECVWKYKKDCYRTVVEHILTGSEEAARFFMTDEEIQGAVKAMYPRTESTPQILVKYILDTEGYVQYLEREKQQEKEKEDLRKLKNLQANVRGALKELTGSVYTGHCMSSYSVKECIRKCDALKQPFTEIALRYIKENSQGLSISETVNRMSMVTCDTGCDSMLLEELRTLLQ